MAVNTIDKLQFLSELGKFALLKNTNALIFSFRRLCPPPALTRGSICRWTPLGDLVADPR